MEKTMYSSKLKVLPLPPLGKAGWPWTEETDTPLAEPKNPWPKISIVTPSYNQGEYIEETIRSVLLQNYPNLEYIIIDGGSTDDTLEIIRKYEPWITCWVSEPDKGQSDAINKGFRYSHGDILAWNNSDDIYEKGALWVVAECMLNNPKVDVVYGNARIIDENSALISELRSVPFHPRGFVYRTVHIAAQSAVFWRRQLLFQVGMVNESLDYVMDFDLILKFIEAGANFRFVHRFLGGYRCHNSSKTFGVAERSALELSMLSPVEQVRKQSNYLIWYFLYRIRQLFWLTIQGDLNYILTRFKAKV